MKKKGMRELMEDSKCASQNQNFVLWSIKADTYTVQHFFL